MLLRTTSISISTFWRVSGKGGWEILGFFFFGKTEKGGKVKVNDDKDGDLRSGLAIRF